MDVLLFIFLITLLTLSSAFFSSSEVALFSLPSHKIKAFQKSNDEKLRHIAALVRQPRNLLVTVFMLNTLSNVLLQNVASNLFHNTSGWTFKVGVPFLLTLLFGEIIPKYLGLRNNLSIAYAVTPFIDFLLRLLGPVCKLTIAITAPISRLLFFHLHKEKEFGKEEIVHALKTAEEHGVIDPTEEEWASGYLNLLEASVKELMRPKEDILFYDIHTPLSKLSHLFFEERYTRLPVCDKDLDHILGTLSSLDFFVYRQRLEEGYPVDRILKKVLFIPEVTDARLLLNRFHRQNEVLALAVDEYGSVTGLITLEDIAEVVIGTVHDYRDHKILYTRAGEDEIIASGRLELTELNHLFGSELSSENMVTVGGWLIERIDGFPKNGFTYESDGLFFHVLTATPRRIGRLYIRKIKNRHAKQWGDRR